MKSSPKSFVLGLDIGSSLVKAVLFDLRGRTVAAAASAVPVLHPAPGCVQRDAAATWRAAVALLRRVVRGRAARIAAIGVTGCGNGAVLLDVAGQPLGPGLLAGDTRAATFAHAREYPGQTAVILRWLRASEPRLARSLRYALFWKDFIRFQLTGEALTEPTDLGAAGFGASATDSALPPVRQSLAMAGTVTGAAARATGLRAGTPVFLGCIDCEAAALGSGVNAPGELSVVAGTWAINQAYVAHPPRRAQSRALFLVNPSVQPDRWLVLEGSPNSASHFDWFARTLGRAGDFDRLASLAARGAVSGPTFIPGLFTGGASFIGLRPGHDLATLVRAVLQGVCFAHRTHVEKLQTAGLSFSRARLAGGASRSDFWCQLFADTLGLPVEIPATSEPGALGAALIAGVGAGLWPSLPAAQRATTRVAHRFTPQVNLDTAYAAWRTRA